MQWKWRSSHSPRREGPRKHLHWLLRQEHRHWSRFRKCSVIRSLAGVCHFQLTSGAESPAREKLMALSCWLLNWVTVPVRVGEIFSTPLGPPPGETKETFQKGSHSPYTGCFFKSCHVSLSQGPAIPLLEINSWRCESITFLGHKCSQQHYS